MVISYGSIGDFVAEKNTMGRNLATKKYMPEGCGTSICWSTTTLYGYDSENRLLVAQSTTSSSFSSTQKTIYDTWDSQGRPIGGYGFKIIWDDSNKTQSMLIGNSITPRLSFDKYNNPLIFGTVTDYGKVCSGEPIGVKPVLDSSLQVLSFAGSTVADYGSHANSSYDFGRTTGTPLSLKLQNLWSQPYDITGIAITGSNSSDFILSQPGSTYTLASKQVLDFGVVFSPFSGTPGFRSASLSVTSSALPKGFTVTFTGSVPMTNATMISAGERSSCAINGTDIVCWGAYLNPVMTAPTQVSVGEMHACVLGATGVACTGSNPYGQTNVPLLITPTQVSAGGQHTCALDSTGVKCWGFNSFGQTNVPILNTPTKVSAGQNHTCALDATGVTCWGYNGNGQTNVPALTSPTQVSAGNGHTCAIDSTGVKCWGYNFHGQTNVPALNTPTQVSAGEFHTCALDASGVKCWGNNSYKQSNVPQLISPTQVSAGTEHTCALDAGSIICWGTRGINPP